MEKTKLANLISGRKVLFVTTKNIDYIRNSQEIRIIKEYAAEVDLLYSAQNNNPLRIIDVLFHLTKKRVEKSDVVFVGFEPQFVLPFKKKLLKKKTLIIDFFISVYDTLVDDRRKFKDGSLFSNICHKVDEITLNCADLIITDTVAHQEFFKVEFKGEDKEFETLYLEADNSIYFSRPQNKPKKLKDKFVVLYFGSILPVQGVDVVLNAARELCGHQEVFFDFIGPIPDKYDKPIQDNICYTEWLTQADLASHIADADLCLAGHFNKFNGKANRTIPGKAYIYDNMEKIIILGDSAANHELFFEDNRHFFVPMGDYKMLAEKILELKNGELS